MNIARLGKAVVERNGTEYLLMLPDGAVEICMTKEAVMKAVNSWQTRRTPENGAAILTIEWRKP